MSHDFAHLGMSAALVLARLGLPAEALVRIRRGAPGVVNVTAPDIPSQEEGRSDVRVCGANITPNPRNSGRRKRLGDTSDCKAGGLPLPAATVGPAASVATAVLGGGVNSPTLRRRLSGAEGSIAAAATADAAVPPSSTLSQSHAQAATRKISSPQLFDSSEGTREGEADRFDPTHPLSPLEESIRDGDVLVLSCSRATMISFQGSVLSEGVRGLEILGSTTAQLQSMAKRTTTNGAAFVELVLSDCNHFVGQSPVSAECALVASRYGCLILAVRHALTVTAAAAVAVDSAEQHTEEEQIYLVEENGRSLAFDEKNAAADRCSNRSFSPLDRDREGLVGNHPRVGEQQQQQRRRTARPSAIAVSHDVERMGAVVRTVEAEHSAGGVEAAFARPLAPGDLVLVVANGGFSETWKDAPEFDLVTWLGAVPKAVVTYDYLSLLVFCGMLGWVLFSSVAMVSQKLVLCCAGTCRVQQAIWVWMAVAPNDKDEILVVSYLRRDWRDRRVLSCFCFYKSVLHLTGKRG